MITLADQAVLGLSGAVTVVVAARAAGAAEFGRFAVGLGLVAVAVGACRSLLGTRISLTPGPAEAHELGSALAGAALPAVTAVAVPALLVAVLLAPGDLPVWVALAVLAPLACSQDLLRFAAVAGDRPGAALVADGVRMALLVVPLLVGARLSLSAVAWLWAAATGLALVTAVRLHGALPAPRAGLGELRRRHPVSEAAALGTLAVTVAAAALLAVAAALVGAAAAGALRGAGALMGPVNVVSAAVVIGLTPVVARRPGGRSLFCARVACGTGVLALAWGAGMLLLPEPAGRALLGDSWTGARALLGWTVTEYVLLALAAAAVLGLKSGARPAALLGQKLTAAGVAIGLGSAAVWLTREVWPAAACAVLAAAASAVLGWRALLTAPRDGTASEAGRWA